MTEPLVESVRPMAPTDIAALDLLQTSARTAFTDARGGAAWLAETPATDWTSTDPARAVFVACLDDVPVGFLELVVAEATASVRQVWIQPAARELGLGDALLAEAMASARHAGCTSIEGTALPGDRDTKNLYERAGVVARKITLAKSL